MANESRTYNSFRNAAINLLARILALICGFVLRSTFLKYLGDQYTGVSTLFTDILNILSFTELGLGTAISFAFYKPIAEQDKYRIAQLMKFCKYVYALISLAILGLGVALIPFLGFFVKNVPDIKESITLIYILYLVKTALSYLLVYKSTLLIAKQKRFMVTLTESCCSTVKTVLAVILLALTRDFIGYLCLEIVCTLLINLIIALLAGHEFKMSKQERAVKIEKKDFSSLLGNVKDVFIYRVSGIVLNSTDSIIVSNAIGVTSVAFLSNYTLITNSINNIAYQIVSAMTASVGNLAVEKGPEEQKRVFDIVNFMCYVFASIVCCGLWLCINPFVEILWGTEYVLSGDIVAMLVINLFVVILHLTVDMFRTANGIFRAGRLRPLFTAIVNLVVSIVAARYLGLFGVLLGTVVSRVSTQLWYDSHIVYKHVFHQPVKFYYFRYIRFATITALICCGGSVMLYLLPQNIWLAFFAGMAYAVCGNIIVLYLAFRRRKECVGAVSYIKAIAQRKSKQG